MSNYRKRILIIANAVPYLLPIVAGLSESVNHSATVSAMDNPLETPVMSDPSQNLNVNLRIPIAEYGVGAVYRALEIVLIQLQNKIASYKYEEPGILADIFGNKGLAVPWASGLYTAYFGLNKQAVACLVQSFSSSYDYSTETVHWNINFKNIPLVQFRQGGLGEGSKGKVITGGIEFDV